MSFTPSHLRPEATLSFSLFPSNLKYLRKRRGLNQEDISALFNKKANTVGNWENGKSEPSIPELLVISGYFGVNLEDLLRSELRQQQADNQQQLSLWPDSTEKNRDQAATQTTALAGRTEAPAIVRPEGTEATLERGDHIIMSAGDAEQKTGPGSHTVHPGDAVWFMLRELRAVQERIDRLQTAFNESKPSDPLIKATIKSSPAERLPAGRSNRYQYAYYPPRLLLRNSEARSGFFR